MDRKIRPFSKYINLLFFIEGKFIFWFIQTQIQNIFILIYIFSTCECDKTSITNSKKLPSRWILKNLSKFGYCNLSQIQQNVVIKFYMTTQNTKSALKNFIELHSDSLKPYTERKPCAHRSTNQLRPVRLMSDGRGFVLDESGLVTRLYGRSFWFWCNLGKLLYVQRAVACKLYFCTYPG